MAGILSSLFTGNTGLQAAATGVSVIGDNIANANTTGFKESRAHFGDLVSEFIVGTTGSDQVGRGVSLKRIEKMFTQGSFQHTGVPTDMAISGDGFFVLNGTAGGRTGTSYSRNGAFRFDENGFLVSQGGQRVQGYTADAAGTIGSTMGDIQVGQSNLEPQQSTEVDAHVNFSPTAQVLAAAPHDPDHPDASNQLHTSIQVFDSLGNAHDVEIFGTRTADDTWTMTGRVPGADVGQAADLDIPLGTLTFNDQGQLVGEAGNANIAIPWVGAQAADITFDFGESINEGGLGTAGSTMFGDQGSTVLNTIRQDGYGTGSLERINVGSDGTISGAYSNGRTVALGQVALARFEDPTELSSIGGNNFMQTATSGEANVGAPGGGGRGAIQNSSLELSNVELSDQFIDLIAYQRAFQANSKTIQTADGLLQEVFQLLR